MHCRAAWAFAAAVIVATQLGCSASHPKRAAEPPATAGSAAPDEAQQSVQSTPPLPVPPSPPTNPPDSAGNAYPKSPPHPYDHPTISPGARPTAVPPVPPTVTPTAPQSNTAQVPQFPWPPPEASAVEVVPAGLLASRGPLLRLGAVDMVLTAALDIDGYSQRSYFAVPQGFAMVTRMEQIELDGSSRRPPGRWSADPPRLSNDFSVGNYIRSLFTADPGYYRVIVFIVTDVPFAQTSQSITTVEAQEWLRSGLNVLPEWIGTQIYTPQVVCTALIYEFERPPNRDPGILLPSRLDAQMHLVRSGLWRALGGS